MPVILPRLTQHESPNQSQRTGPSAPYLVVVHRPVGSYLSATATFLDPTSQVSAHVLTEGASMASQFVPWDRKAWACAAFNSASYNIEVDDDAWTGRDPAALATAARVVAFLCKRTGIPPAWSRDPMSLAGICRHYDLGKAGGGHSDPTTDTTRWRSFLGLVRTEYDRGGFRPTWGVGNLARVDL